MQVLIADDEPTTLKLIANLISELGHAPVLAQSGDEALRILSGPKSPRIAVLDWVMPGLSGLELCREIRKTESLVEKYIILVTVRDEPDDLIRGLDAGANDYITKPFNRGELRARVNVGLKTIQLLDEVKELRELVPICCVCKKIRDEKSFWHTVEEYFGRRSNLQFTHGICTSCKESYKKA